MCVGTPFPIFACHLGHRTLKVPTAKRKGGGMPALNCLSLCQLLKQAQGPNLAAQEVGRVVEYMKNVVSAISPTVCLLPIHLRGSIKESIVSSAGGGAQGSGNVLCMVTGTLRVKKDLCLLPFTASSYHMTICDGAYMHVWLGFFPPTGTMC